MRHVVLDVVLAFGSFIFHGHHAQHRRHWDIVSLGRNVEQILTRDSLIRGASIVKERIFDILTRVLNPSNLHGTAFLLRFASIVHVTGIQIKWEQGLYGSHTESRTIHVNPLDAHDGVVLGVVNTVKKKSQLNVTRVEFIRPPHKN